MKKLKNKIFFTIIVILISFTALGITQKIQSGTRHLHDYYIKIDRVQITDTLKTGTYTLYIGVNWQRVFGDYGDSFMDDDEYENGLRSYDNAPSDWVTYGESLDGNKLKTYETNAYTETGYCVPITDYGSDEIYLWLRLKKITSTDDYYGIPLTVTLTYAWSTDFEFPDKGGEIRVYYCVM
ncbi:MAG: hypothetical protein HZR80_19040 [Candidatus Heimdallarchaeota archaeon]